MDSLVITAIVLVVVLVVLWIFYNVYTGRIIKDLIAENTALIKDLRTLKHLNAILSEAIVDYHLEKCEHELKTNKNMTDEDIKKYKESLYKMINGGTNNG